MLHNEVIEISSVKAKKNEKKIRSMVFLNSKSNPEEKAKKICQAALSGTGVFDGSLFFSEGFEDVPCGFEQLDCRVGHVPSVEGFGFGIVEVKSDGLNVLSIPGFVDAAEFAFTDDEAKSINHINQKICFFWVHLFSPVGHDPPCGGPCC